MSLPPVIITTPDGASVTLLREERSVRVLFSVPTAVEDSVAVPTGYEREGDGVAGAFNAGFTASVTISTDTLSIGNNSGSLFEGSLEYEAEYLPPDPVVLAPNQGQAPVDLASAVGQVRLLVGDTDPRDVVGGLGTFMWYSDDEITTLLALHAEKPRLVAAGILRAVAVTQAMKLKRWSSADLSVNGPAVADALFKAAAALVDEQRGEDDAAAGDFFLMAPVGGRDAYAAQARIIDGNLDRLTFTASRVTEILGDAAPTWSA